jgi:hypothetical protein
MITTSTISPTSYRTIPVLATLRTNRSQSKRTRKMMIREPQIAREKVNSYRRISSIATQEMMIRLFRMPSFSKSMLNNKEFTQTKCSLTITKSKTNWNRKSIKTIKRRVHPNSQRATVPKKTISMTMRKLAPKY